MDRNSLDARFIPVIAVMPAIREMGEIVQVCEIGELSAYCHETDDFLQLYADFAPFIMICVGVN